MKTILSSKRVIKHTGTEDTHIIESYVLPVELEFNVRQKEAQKAVFPRYTRDGKPVEESDAAFPEPEEQEEALEPEESEEEAEARRMLDETIRILEGARREADEILGKARRQAVKEHEAAREAGYKAGYETGYEDGRRKALESGQQEVEDHIAAFEEDMRKALQSVEKAKEICVRNYLDELKDCAIAIGEKVIRVSLRSSGEVIRQMIISATEKLKKTAWVKIYIDKMDYDMMMEADADIIDELSHLSDNIKFIVMDKEDCGDCIIEMPEEIVDVSVNTQIENIKDILENVRV